LTLIVGLLLGLVGGGGSIVVVPILVYVVGLPASAAIALSLPIVGLTSLAGAIVKGRNGEVHAQALWLFGVAGGVGAVIGAQLTKMVPEPFLLLLFAALLLGVGVRMWRGRGEDELLCDNECNTSRCLIAGWGVGVLTGFLGVGGGFLLVPSLRRFANQTMKLATGTSLGIIAFNSAGFVAHLGEVRNLLPLAAAFTFAALAVALYLAVANAPQAARMLSAYL
jgi:uncharacterized membrane protein YfcA